MIRRLMLSLAIGLIGSTLARGQEAVYPPEKIPQLRALAENGDAKSQAILGSLYGLGDGVPKDKREAVKWFRRAAEQGLDGAQMSLGISYYMGEAVPKDYAEAARWFRLAAEQGHTNAQYLLGGMYINGYGVAKDDTEAYMWHLLSSAKGNKDAQRSVEMLEETLTESQRAQAERRAREFKPRVTALLANSNTSPSADVSQSLFEASDWRLQGDIDEIRAAAEKGDAKSQFLLSYRYSLGYGLGKDLDESVKWCRKSADQGYAEAQTLLAAMYQYGEGVPEDKAAAVMWYRKAADQGHYIAQSHLGEIYSRGEGIATDLAEAYKWLILAREQGWENAGALLEKLKPRLTSQQRAEGLRRISEFNKRETSPADHPVARADVAKESIQSPPSSKPSLGTAVREPRKISPAGSKASPSPEEIANLRAQAEKGNYESQFLLGVLYSKGDGVPQDFNEARKWYRKAADQGDAPAQVALGSSYVLGKGVSKDPAEAAKWFRMAADQGNVDGQWSLGTLYFMGQGVPVDKVEAYKWYLLASAQGSGNAKKGLDLLERELTVAEQADGRRRSLEFKPQTLSLTPNPVLRQDIAEPTPKFMGSGFFVTDDGYFISNEHVIGKGSQVRITTAKGTIAATVVKVDKANDLALLKAEGHFTALPVTSSRGVRLGAAAATVGFPNVPLQGSSPKLARGEIASLAGIHDDARHFQISVPIQPGNSGGALVDERGNVIGVVALKLSEGAARASTGMRADHVNYAVKSSYLLSFLEAVPEIADKLKNPNGQDRKFEEIVKDAEQAAGLVLVY